MLDKKNLFELAKIVANAKSSAPVAYSFGDQKFSYSDLNETLRTELNNYASTYALYRENQNLIFSLIEQTIDDVIPQRVMEQYGRFAEIKTFARGDKPVFTQRVTAASRRRAKQFITTAHEAGVYEVFKLDGKSFEVKMTAVAGAAQIGLEEFLSGRIDFSTILDILMEAIDESIYVEIEKALLASVTSLQDANKHIDIQFKEGEMDKLLAVADSYGKSTIYCTFEFAAEMHPDSNSWISDNMKDKYWENGYLGNYKGHDVIILNQSFTDETNTKKVIDPSYAWIIPVGADKPVKIAFEGETMVDEWKNQDWSREVRAFKNFGVGTIITNNICIYQNSSLKK